MARNITITFADGSSHVYQNVPDTASPDMVQSRAESEFKKPIKALDGGNSASSQDSANAQALFTKGPLKVGADAFPDALRETLRDTNWGTRNIAGAGSAVVSAWEGIKGLIGKTDSNQVAQQKIIADEAPIGNLAGNMAMLAPTALIPGANTVTGAATIGAAQGALLTPGGLADRAKAAAFGGGGGAVGAGLSKVLSRVDPLTINPNVEILSKEGIGLTPGQNAGGFFKSMEDKATSIPLLGDVIGSARKRGIEDFNKAAIIRATIPGMRVQGIGNTAVQDLRTGLGQAYDDVLSRSSANTAEPQFVQQMSQLRQLVSGLPKKEQRAFDSIVSREIGERTSPNGLINAENLQAAKSGLGKQIDNFGQSSDGYQRQLAQALKQADEEFRGLVKRANPQNATELKAIDTAYANFKRIQRAASSVGAEDGVFTPAQLHNAVKAMDRTKDKRAFSEGAALLQDLTSAGKATLPSKVPDSGTAGRFMSNLFSLQGLINTGMGAAAAVPAYMAYSRPGSAAINSLTNNAAIPLSELIRSAIANNPNVSRIASTALPKLMGN